MTISENRGAASLENLGTVSLPGEAREARTARSYARGLLGERLGEDHPLLDDIDLCVGELVANAVEHTDSEHVVVAVHAAGAILRVEVTDSGGTATRPHIRDEPDAESGRGLLLVGELSSRWGVSGTTTWCEFDLAEAGEAFLLALIPD